ncbi:ClpXP protease specificity-enhancing factor SspB [Rhodobacter sp. KR11]|uniref:SspB family protein n=1 Tax=Rhodobacter sp. KR11 TaxID=2974588 RepID=UPI002222479F|nr:ClpXP protease specificity-enhancing factor SspB [Rhodobacter sp. KR11]MCW1917677.1 ClpXP protease specificity-enhancing factor SspB [Rhodobacter sp. KR11]
MAKSIDYGNLMHVAMRGLIQTVLEGVARDGLPGSHHFYITFDTNAEGVDMPDWLRKRYPAEMTIVMQHWFDDLQVTAEGFAITLNFGDMPSRMTIPFDALRTFVDPSVEFGLRFDSHAEDEDDEEDDDPEPDPTPPQDAQVVRLDRFRKS